MLIGCENDSKCPNNGWIHIECDEQLKKLSREEIEKVNFYFLCRDCNKPSNNNSKENKGKRKSKKK